MRYFLTLILMLFLITPSFAGWDGKYYCFCPTSDSCEYFERGSIKNMSQHHYSGNHYIRVLLKDGRVRVFNYQNNLDRFDISFHHNMMFFLEDLDDTDNYDYVFSPKFKTTIIKSNTVSLIENFIINGDFCIKVHLKEDGYKLFNYTDDAEAMTVQESLERNIM